MATADYNRAMSDIRKGLTIAQGAGDAELRAQQAYSRMVATGDAAPLKRKYRVGRRLKKVR